AASTTSSRGGSASSPKPLSAVGSVRLPSESSHQREQSRLPGELVVVGGHRRDDPLVEELQIAWVNGLRLVGIVANEVPAADVARPGRAAETDVGLAGERIALG